ncbi:hypothetical protein F5X96DRAFT_613926 [Biscogniauxia mediterranea]|nr:hypothetical protein F5X96DRAFT_613926 [Biscogniauxia mediterranea]
MKGLLQSIDSMEMRLSMLETKLDTPTLAATGMGPTTRSSIQESPIRTTSTVLVPFSSAIMPNAEHTSSSTRHPSPTTTLTVKPVTVNGSISMSSYTTVFSYVPPTPIIDSGEPTSTTTVTSTSIVIVHTPNLSTAPLVFEPTLRPSTAASTVSEASTFSQAISTTALSRSIASSVSVALTHSRAGGWNTTLTSATNIFTTMPSIPSFPFSVSRTRHTIPKNETITLTSTVTTRSRSTTTTVRVTTTISGCLDTDSSSVASSVTIAHDLANSTTRYRFTHTRVGVPVSRIHRGNSSTTNSFHRTASSKYLASSVPTAILGSNQTSQRLSKLHTSLTYVTTVPNSHSTPSTSMSVDTESRTTRWVL